MSSGRYFLDTAFVQALFSRGDQYHQAAVALLPQFENAAEIWTTEAVVIEIGNALSGSNRLAAVEFIGQIYRSPHVQIVSI